MGDILGIGKSSIQRILSDLLLTRYVHGVLRILNDDQMQSRASASSDFLKKTQRNDTHFCLQIVTMDERCLHYFEP